MSRTPAVTVVMPAYNAARYIDEAVRSVLGQTYADLELLVIDDGSTDETPAILATISDQRLRYVRHDRNRGLVAVLNEGLDVATGRYIARMDADDVMHPERVEKQVAFLEANPSIDAVAAFVDLIDADGERTGEWGTDRATVTEQGIRAMMPRTNCIAHPTMVIRRSALKGLRYAGRFEDWDLWLQMLSRGRRIAKIPEALLQHRMHPTSYTAGHKRQRSLEHRLLSARWDFLMRAWGKGRLSTYHALVLKAQARTLARYLLDHVLRPFARDAYRLLTYAPWILLKEQRALRKALDDWHGRHLCLFPYVHTGGAEQVHADILETVADQQPLCLIIGFSRDRSYLGRFSAHARVAEVPRLMNHPFTRRRSLQRIAAAVNARQDASVLASNCAQFFDLLPLLHPEVRSNYLQHAFLFQPDGNAQHKAWVKHFARIDRYVFIALHARDEFRKFLHAQGVPSSRMGKLAFIPNRVHRFAPPEPHEGPMKLLFVGRESPEKRFELFMRIAERLAVKRPGAFAATAVGIARRSDSTMDFKGAITDADELSRIYGAHDALVVTSSREGFPLVVQEAMAHGLLIAATPVGDIPLRLDADCAVLAECVDADAVVGQLVNALLALQAEPDRVMRMRQHAYAKAAAEYDEEAFRSAYRSLLG